MAKMCLTLELDVTNPEQVTAVVAQAHAHFGKLDIVLNNAGYSLVGTIEEAGADEVRALYDTNIFGPLSVIRAVLCPCLRKQGGGHILGTSSNLGHVTIPVIGYYCSSKWAFEAIHESLAAEVKQFGIKVTIIEPGAYATEFGSQESLKFAAGLSIYTDFKAQFVDRLKNLERGDPNATPEALFKMVDDRKSATSVLPKAATICPVYALYMRSDWPPGKHGEAVSASAQGKLVSKMNYDNRSLHRLSTFNAENEKGNKHPVNIPLAVARSPRTWVTESQTSIDQPHQQSEWGCNDNNANGLPMF